MKCFPRFSASVIRRSVTRAVFLSLGLSTLLHAQPAAVKADDADSTRENDLVKLNVFVVADTKGQGYGASNLASATRLNTPSENVPQSISVVNANLLRDIGAYSFEQTMRYTPGVTPRQNAPNASIVRGFIVANRYRNGFLMPQYEIDIANLDRIEVIKGPSASIAGSSESGGLVNVITKRPLFQAQNEASFTIGSYNFQRAVIDSTGPIPGRSDMAFRLIAAGTRSDTYRDNDQISKAAVYPSFAWNIGKHTQVLIEGELLDANTPAGFGAVYFAPIEAGAPFSTVPPPTGVTARVQLNRWAPLTLNTSGEPGMHWKHKITGLFATVIHEFTDYLSARQGVVYYQLIDDHYWASVDNTLYFDALGNLMAKRTMTNRVQDTRGVKLQGDLALKKQFAENRFGLVVLAGYDVADVRFDLRQSTGVLQPMNLVDPVYGTPPTTPLSATVDQHATNGSVGIFGNAQISGFNDRVILTGGYRRDYNKASSVTNNFNNTRVDTPKTPTIKSPLIGLTVKPLRWMSLYAVDSEAGAAQTTISIFPGIPVNDPLQILKTIEPVTTNREYGAKMNFFNGNFSVNLAKFKIVQSDFVRPQTDLSAPGGSYRIIDQGVTADGFEIEVAGDLTKQLLVFGGYAHMKTKVPAVRPGGLDGEQRGVPREKVQLFARYNFSPSGDRGFSVRGGVVHQSSPWGIAQNTYRVPGATRYDAGLDYRSGPWTISFTIENLTDVIFAQAAIAAGSNTVDAPRSFYLSAGRKF